MTGLILDYEHFAVHDGPGIRLVVFLKGCPLRCRWCHTPESQRGDPELLYCRERCLDCGSCGGLSRRLPLTSFSAEELSLARRCPVRAVVASGVPATAEEVVAEAAKERMFFSESGGGLTVSGGEPLFQAEFTLEIVRAAAARNIRCCIETCGYGRYEDLKKLLPYTDIFLYDCKASDPEQHRKFTGVDNTLILENLRKLNADGARIQLRCPLIPGVNDRKEHLLAIAALAEELEHVEAVHVEPFHPMARGKYQNLNRPYENLPKDFPTEAEIGYYVDTIARHTGKPVSVP